MQTLLKNRFPEVGTTYNKHKMHHIRIILYCWFCHFWSGHFILLCLCLPRKVPDSLDTCNKFVSVRGNISSPLEGPHEENLS